MSIPIEPQFLEQHMRGRPFAYVVSMSTSRPHVIAIRAELFDGHLDCSQVGKSTRRNIVSNPSVTIVFPPAADISDDEFAKYSLVIDGSALPEGDRLLVRIESAVLHRPAE